MNEHPAIRASSTLRGAAVTSACLAQTGGNPASSPVGVPQVGSFHLGGRQVSLSGLPCREVVLTQGGPPLEVDPNGDFETGQMYVQYVRQSGPFAKAKHPLLLWHGGGLTGVTWETTPDGRPGWQQYFLNAGHDVYVSDAVERGRASWSRYPEIYDSEPVFRTKRESWELFRFGPVGSYDPAPERRTTFAGTRFDVSSFEQLAKQTVPRWTSNDAATQAAYDALVDRIGPCVIVAHSQGGNFAFRAALRAPDQVKAVIAIEPSGAPDPDEVDLSGLRAVPQLFIWGDFIDDAPFWRTATPNVRRYADALARNGGVSDWMPLPELGIRGNSHMPMMDRNSDAIAGMVQDWLTRQGLMK